MSEPSLRARAKWMFGAGRCVSGKTMFPVRWKASNYRQAMVDAGTRRPESDHLLVEYRCHLCKTWHVGHLPAAQLQVGSATNVVARASG